MAELWRRLGTSDAISWVTTAAFAPTALLFVLFSSGVPHSTSSFWRLVLASAMSSAVTLIWLGVARLVVFGRLIGPAGGSRPVAVLVSFGVALVVRALSFDALLLAFGLSAESHLVYRLVSSVPSTGGVLVGLAILVSFAREYRRHLARFEHTQLAFAELAASAPARIEAERARVVELARVGIDERLRDLNREAPPAALERVRLTIEDVVRPLSHDLVASGQEPAVIPEAPPGSLGWAAVWRGVLDANPIRPFWFTAWLTVTALLFAPRLWGAGPGFAFVGLTAVCTACFCAAGSLLWPVLLRCPRRLRALAYSLLAMLSASVVGFGSAAFSPAIAREAAVLVPVLAAASLFTAWVFAGLFSLRRHNEALLVRLEEAEGLLHQERVRSNALLRSEMRTLARVLHGPVQDALSAAAFRISGALNGGAVSAELLGEVRRSVAEAVERMPLADREAGAATEVLGQIAELWAGVAEVGWRLDPEAEAALAAHTATRSSFNEIVREACSNAVRHGDAAAVRISAELTGGELTIEVRNTGRPVSADAVPGFGTHLLDELALEWSRHAEASGTRLAVRLPLVD